MKSMTRLMLLPLSMAVLCAGSVWAGNVTIPNDFSPNTPAIAEEVNENFNVVAEEVNDNDERINTNASNISANTTSIQGKQNRVADACPDGEYMRAIAENGTVTCARDRVGVAPPMPGIEFGRMDNLSDISTDVNSAGFLEITAPDNGPDTAYILVQISGQGVTTGESTVGVVGIGDSADELDFSTTFGVLEGTDTKPREFPLNVIGVYTVEPGQSKEIHLLAYKSSTYSTENVNVQNLYMTIIYIPYRY